MKKVAEFFRIFSKKRVPQLLPAPTFSKEKMWGRFHIISTLNRTDRGITLRAQDPKRRRSAILKILLHKLGAFKINGMNRKSRAFIKIGSPYLMKYYEISKNNGYTYLISEDSNGHTLDKELAEGPLGTHRAIMIFEQILIGLEACHDNKQIHGNLKSSNILIQRDGSVKLMDFDWTTAGGEECLSVTYAAPEVIAGEKQGKRSDLYSAGIIFFELLTGKVPFTTNEREKILGEKLHAPSQHVRNINNEVPGWLDNLIQRLMARKPADRPLSASEARTLLHIGLGV